ncbi:MAG: leucyl/phenylalanyl-tRNA--protein transferase [Desulfatibacillaceae bacterium]
MPVYALGKEAAFPHPHLARRDGLLAIGGDLSPRRLLNAYCMGIFPWYSEGEPILWWCPDPRLVVDPGNVHVARSLGKLLRQRRFTVTYDTAFERVIRACATVRTREGRGTWLLPEMVEAYCRLHRMGFAHSVEAWAGTELAGGLYGVALGRGFFGESMFYRESNASKVAFVTLARFLADQGYQFIDCQMTTGHLLRLGAREVPRHEFLDMLKRALSAPTQRGRWTSNSPLKN